MSLRPAREMKMSTKTAMMLRYSLDRPERAAHIEKAIRTVLRKEYRPVTSGRRVASASEPAKCAMPR